MSQYCKCLRIVSPSQYICSVKGENIPSVRSDMPWQVPEKMLGFTRFKLFPCVNKVSDILVASNLMKKTELL